MKKDDSNKVKQVYIGNSSTDAWQHLCKRTNQDTGKEQSVIRHITNRNYCGVCGWEHEK